MVDKPQAERPAITVQPRDVLPSSVLNRAESLSLGQVLVTGRIEGYDSPGRTMLFNDERLTLWSLYPFQRGWLRQGDRLVVVYQKLPFDKKLLMVYRSESQNSLRTVAATVATLTTFISLATALLYLQTSDPWTTFVPALCVFWGVLGVTYLVLMFRALAMLRKFLVTEI